MAKVYVSRAEEFVTETQEEYDTKPRPPGIVPRAPDYLTEYPNGADHPAVRPSKVEVKIATNTGAPQVLGVIDCRDVTVEDTLQAKRAGLGLAGVTELIAKQKEKIVVEKQENSQEESMKKQAQLSGQAHGYPPAYPYIPYAYPPAPPAFYPTNYNLPPTQFQFVPDQGNKQPQVKTYDTYEENSGSSSQRKLAAAALRPCRYKLSLALPTGVGHIVLRYRCHELLVRDSTIVTIRYTQPGDEHDIPSAGDAPVLLTVEDTETGRNSQYIVLLLGEQFTHNGCEFLMLFRTHEEINYLRNTEENTESEQQLVPQYEQQKYEKTKSEKHQQQPIVKEGENVILPEENLGKVEDFLALLAMQNKQTVKTQQQ